MGMIIVILFTLEPRVHNRKEGESYSTMHCVTTLYGVTTFIMIFTTCMQTLKL